MSVRLRARVVMLSSLLAIGVVAPVAAEQAQRADAAPQKVRVTGVVRDESNAITLPGIPVLVVATGETVYTDVDGRYILNLPPGSYELKVVMDGYQERLVKVEVPTVFYYYNHRLQFVEEGLMSNAVGGEHFLRGLSNSRIDWRVSYGRATRHEPDLREVLYQQPFLAGSLLPNPAVAPVLSDESQSGFRLFNRLDDNTLDVAANWSVFSTAGNRPTQVTFGVNYVERTRDFESRRFRFIPIVLTKDGVPPISLQLTPEELYAPTNIGTAFRFNEETRPVDAYNGDQNTAAGYGMLDISLSARTRLVAGARVERYRQEVNTFDPFGHTSPAAASRTFAAASTEDCRPGASTTPT